LKHELTGMRCMVYHAYGPPCHKCVRCGWVYDRDATGDCKGGMPEDVQELERRIIQDILDIRAHREAVRLSQIQRAQWKTF